MTETEEQHEQFEALGPVPARERIAALDVLRGVALFGIFMVNMQVFSMTFGDWVQPEITVDTPLIDVLCWLGVKVFFELKFISLFSMMFGMGLIVQWWRAEERERPFVSMYLRRLAVLALFGLVHGLLIWYGDILFVYACVGLIVMWARPLSPKVMLIIAGSILGFLVGLQLLIAVGILVFTTWFAEPESAEPEPETPAAELATFADEHPEVAERYPWIAPIADAGFQPQDERFREGETSAYKEGPFLAAQTYRVFEFAIVVATTPLGAGWHVVIMFLTGMALMKLEFFSPLHAALQKRLAVVGVGAGLTAELISGGLLYYGTVNDNMGVAVLAMATHQVGAVLLCLGLLGLVTRVVAGGRLKGLTNAIASVGRMALSVYIGQSVVSTFLMYGYGWGLGWYGDVSRIQQVGLVVLIYAAMVPACVLWLKVFRFGPLEWLWRSLTYMRPQPLLRSRE